MYWRNPNATSNMKCGCTVLFLVSTHVVCEGLSAMQEQARLPEVLVQNSLSTPTFPMMHLMYLRPPPWTDKHL